MTLAQADIRALPLAAGSVDLIFTDPPYAREYLYCYEWLAREAARVLKPGGFVLAMCGNLYVNQIYRMFDSAGIDYFYNFFHKTGNNQGMGVWVSRNGQPGTRVPTSIKMILAYSKGPARPRIGQVMSFFETSENGKSKEYHSWGQDINSATYFINSFSGPGDLVLDPFLGGGTSAVACELTGRRWLGFDLDPAALCISRDRMSGSDIPYRLPLFEGMAL